MDLLDIFVNFLEDNNYGYSVQDSRDTLNVAMVHIPVGYRLLNVRIDSRNFLFFHDDDQQTCVPGDFDDVRDYISRFDRNGSSPVYLARLEITYPGIKSIYKKDLVKNTGEMSKYYNEAKNYTRSIGFLNQLKKFDRYYLIDSTSDCPTVAQTAQISMFKNEVKISSQFQINCCGKLSENELKAMSDSIFNIDGKVATISKPILANN